MVKVERLFKARLVYCFLPILTAFSSAQESKYGVIDAPMVSGQPILVGGNGGVGPLPSIGISSTPLGFAHVYDGKRPDIFVSSDRWYPGFHLYRYVKDTPNGVPVFSPPIEIDASELPKMEDHFRDILLSWKNKIFNFPREFNYGPIPDIFLKLL